MYSRWHPDLPLQSKPHITLAWDGYIWIRYLDPMTGQIETAGGNYYRQAWWRYTCKYYNSILHACNLVDVAPHLPVW